MFGVVLEPGDSNPIKLDQRFHSMIRGVTEPSIRQARLGSVLKE